MKLSILLKDIFPGDLPEELGNRDISAISADSRLVKPHSLFVALKGSIQDGKQFIPEAAARGASVVVYEDAQEGIERIEDHPDTCGLKVKDVFQFLKDVLNRFYGDPAGKIKTIGITGTNGKTTTTYLLESILRAAGRQCGVIGTVNHRIGSQVTDAKNTTPGLVENQLFFARLVGQNIPYCVMEVSSHALEQGRVDNIPFTCAIFTNLTLDHLDYHKDMENYFKAKSLLFERLPPEASAVLNYDDPYGFRLSALTKGKIVSYGLDSRCAVRAAEIDLTLSGSRFILQTPSGNMTMTTSLIGRHNIYNILASAAAAVSQGFSLEVIRQGVEQLRGVPGRLEAVEGPKDFHVFVDYAHTDDALQNVLKNLKAIAQAKIITVFGCGGNRDASKRPKMGRVAGELSDWSIITNDNPRGEEPQEIAREVSEGFLKQNYEIVLDRQKAIVKAFSMAQQDDIVLVAGKGHENYQIFRDKTIHFDDREIIRDYFSQ